MRHMVGFTISVPNTLPVHYWMQIFTRFMVCVTIWCLIDPTLSKQALWRAWWVSPLASPTYFLFITARHSVGTYMVWVTIWCPVDPTSCKPNCSLVLSQFPAFLHLVVRTIIGKLYLKSQPIPGFYQCNESMNPLNYPFYWMCPFIQGVHLSGNDWHFLQSFDLPFAN